jgi:hypothetical protein
VGKNYCYQISGNAVTVFFEDKEINPFMAPFGGVRTPGDVDDIVPYLKTLQ